MRFLWLIPFLVLVSCTQPSGLEGVRSWVYQLQDIDVKTLSSTDFDLVVIDYSKTGDEEGKFTREEIESLKDSGKIVVAYISVGEAEDYRFYWKDEWYEDPPEWLGSENPEWGGNYAVRYWMEGWREILKEYLSRIESQGFDGVYLDKVDEYEYWSDPENGEKEYYEEEIAAASMIDLIGWIRSKFDGIIFIQNGEGIVEYESGKVLYYVDGIAIEDLFYIETERASDEWIDERLSHVSKFLDSGKICLSVDYVDDGTDSDENEGRILDYVEKARDVGCIPYVAMSDRELDEVVVIEGVQP